MTVALSLRQPWSWVILNLGKSIENRDWNTSFRGDFLIHASKGCTKAEYYECLDTCVSILGSTSMRTFPPLRTLDRGGIVGAAKLVGVIPPCAECTQQGECGKEHGWHFPEKFGLVLESVRPSPRFVPCKGMLGFFRVGEDVLKELRRP